MKVGFFPKYMDGHKTGTDNYYTNLITNLAEIGKSSEIYVIRQKNNDDGLSGLTNEILIPTLPSLLKTHLGLPYVGLPYIIKKADLDVIHVTWHLSEQITSFYLNYGTRKVITIHDLVPYIYPETTPGKQFNFFWKTILKLIKNRADAIIAVSNHTKMDCIKYLGIPEEKIRVIYEATDEIFKPVKNDKEETQKYLENKYGIKFPFILSVGTVEEKKNIPNVIKAFYRLKKAGNNHKLVIVGKLGWKYDEVFKTINDLDLMKNVILTGYVPDEDLVKLYNTADIFVYPSIYEGFGLPPLEAMACGCPVITSNTSSLPEVVGDAGVLIDPLDSKSIADEMHNILTNNEFKNELRKKSLERAKLFSWRETAKETWKVYEEILK
jgi:glycosyltransferase involved in cell wall biosynthesis